MERSDIRDLQWLEPRIALRSIRAMGLRDQKIYYEPRTSPALTT
jgi:hypothetical protein